MTALTKPAGTEYRIAAELTIVRSFPDVNEATGSEAFSVSTAQFAKWASEGTAWAHNAEWLDQMASKNAIFQIANADKIRAGSTAMKEILYLMKRGYRISDSGNTLIPR